MALSANTTIRFLEPEAYRPKKSYAVAGSKHLYHGALGGLLPSGYAKPFEPGDVFCGIADEEFNNTSTTDGAVSALGDDGERNKPECRFINGGSFVFTLSGVAITDIGKAVYATSDNAIALTGHPDSFVGYITDKYGTDLAEIRMRNQGERAPRDGSSIEIMADFAALMGANLDENDGYIYPNLKVTGVGAGLTAGTTGVVLDQDNGEALLLIDNDAEVESITIETPRCFNITKGITAEFECRKSVAAATAADLDFGVAGGIDLTTTQYADMQDTTASYLYALFHVDCEDNNVDFASDDNASPVAVTDTTFDNETGTNHTFKVIVRTTGVVEVWIDGVRKLSSTSFSVGASGILAGIFNIEKPNNTDVPAARLRKMRICGALA